MKRLLIFGLCFLLSLSIFPSTIYATEETTESTESFDIFDALFENMANAKVDEEDLKEANKELFDDENYNPLQNAKNSIKKFIAAFSKKDYNEEDFNGNVEEVYEGISDGAQEIIDSKFLDTVYGFGISVFNLFTNIISSIGEALQ